MLMLGTNDGGNGSSAEIAEGVLQPDTIAYQLSPTEKSCAIRAKAVEALFAESLR